VVTLERALELASPRRPRPSRRPRMRPAAAPPPKFASAGSWSRPPA